MFKLFRPHFFVASFILIQLSFPTLSTFAENQYLLKTNYAEIVYSDENELSDFIWRISGKKVGSPVDLKLAKLRVDMIIDRVTDILDMHPDNFYVKIDIKPHYEEGMIALYSHSTKTIIVYADRVTDGVFAHEIAHAVISNYFAEPPPRKIQEILAQYVDRHLWTDY